MNKQAIKTNQAALTFPDVLLGIFAISFVMNPTDESGGL